MRTGTGLVRPQNVCADNDLIFHPSCRGRRCRPWEANGFPYRLPMKFRDVSLRVRAKPISQRLFARHSRIERVRVARGDNLMKNFPDRVVILGRC